MKKIYDCFNFFNELDILELRLNILYEYVDKFIIIESNVTHSGDIKPFYFEDNKNRFKKFLDKIEIIKIYDTPNDFINLPITNDKCVDEIYTYIKNQTKRFNRIYQIDYGRDFYQKECVRRGLLECNDDDVIIISDADEIPNPEIFERLNELDLDNKIYSLNQPTYYYYLNVLKQKDWYGSKLLKYKNLHNVSINEIRGDDSLSIKLNNGGWHFSFQGGKEMIQKKLISYSARDMVNDHVLSNIDNNIENNIDPFFRSNLTEVDIDDTYPKYLLNNLEKYKPFIK